MRMKLNKTVAIASMLFAASIAEAAPYTYEIKQNWTSNSDATVYGTMADLYITVDNGNSTNQSQTYSWANVTALSIDTDGTFSAVWDWPSHYTGTGVGESFSDTLFTTDATGNLANFLLTTGSHYINSNVGSFLQFASGGYTNLAVNDGIHGYASIHPWSADTIGNLEVNNVPEPASIALLASGLLGFGYIRRKSTQA